MELNYILYVLGIFIFLKYGIKEINIIYLLIISFGIVYYLDNYSLFKKKNIDERSNYKIKIENEVDVLLNKIKKYDNNNLFLKIRKNIKNIYEKLAQKNSKVDDIFLLKDRILDYINSLNIEHDDNNIDNVYLKIESILNNKIDKYKSKFKLSNYLFSNIMGKS